MVNFREPDLRERLAQQARAWRENVSDYLGLQHPAEVQYREQQRVRYEAERQVAEVYRAQIGAQREPVYAFVQVGGEAIQPGFITVANPPPGHIVHHGAFGPRLENPKWVRGSKQIAAIGEHNIREEHRDEEGRFHCETGPAIITTSGSEYYFWHGLEADRTTIVFPQLISLDSIDGYMDAGYHQVTQAMLERYIGEDPNDGLDGFKRYFRDSKGRQTWRVQDIDQFGILAKRVFRRGEDIAMVEVKNRTREPDGSFKTHYLRVPPATLTAREGVAWSFRMSADEYQPAIES